MRHGKRTFTLTFELPMIRSDPNSPNYGNHLSPEEVLQFFEPSEDRVKAVTEWLVSEGISASRISRSRNKQVN